MLKKITDIALETTSSYREKSKLNVRLWNQDKGVSVLKFLVTRDNFPLSLSSENVKMIIVIENGENFISSDDFEISSEVDGVASFQIPDDFMAAATGECVAQVYVGTLDNDEVVVYRQITFEVSQDLLSSIPSELKLQYIKTFSDLRQEIQDRITALENEFLAMEDYVVSVNQATTDGLTALNNLVNAKTVEYNDNHANKLALINNTVDGYVQDFLDQRSYIDTKYTEFQTAVGESGVVTDADAESWQKYKLTNDDGSRIYLNKDSFTDIKALPVGLYESVSGIDALAQGFPAGVGNSSYVIIDITASGNGRKQLKVTRSINARTFVKYIHTDGVDDTGWKEVLAVSDISTIETVTGSQNKANIAENNAKVYTDEKIATTHKILFSGSVNGSGNVINLDESFYNYKMVIISGSWAGGTFYEVVIPQLLGSTINVQKFNLVNSSGNLSSFYELTLNINSGIKITIDKDVSYEFTSGEGNGSRNAFTIAQIEGFN